MNARHLWKHSWVFALASMALQVAAAVGTGIQLAGKFDRSTLVALLLFIGTSLGYSWVTYVLFQARSSLRSRADFVRVLAKPWSGMSRTSLPIASSQHDTDVWYLKRMTLENIRCFETMTLDFDSADGLVFTTLLLGDNALGKSTILRSIALGLCPESDAVALMKDLKGHFLREGQKEGRIILELTSGQRQGIISTIIQSSGGNEIVRQSTQPANFPWHQVFLCGYGTQRTSDATTSHERYLARLAVGSLFNDDAKLLNPEVVLLRRPSEVRECLQAAVLRLLMLEQDNAALTESDRGILLQGPWGTQPLHALSDGFRSTAQWVLDFLGWQIFAGRFSPEGAGGGILLLDEIEQHLHPRWQRHVVQLIQHVQSTATWQWASWQAQPFPSGGPARFQARRRSR